MWVGPPAPPRVLWRCAIAQARLGVERYTRSEAAASREDGVEDDETLEFHLSKLENTYPYATFASASLAPGRRRSKNHPTPPHATHIRGMTVNEGSTPRHAAVCSAMVSGIL